MSDHNGNSLTARLVVQRLAMPGVLDRTPVQQKYERSRHLQQVMVKHELTGQLHQRATASSDAGGSSLVWRRPSEGADATAEGLPMSSGTASVAAAGSTPISGVSSPAVPTVNTVNPVKIVQRAALPEAESAAVTERLTSRAQSPGVLAAGSTVARPTATSSFSDAPAFAAHLQSRYGATTSESAAAAASVHAAPGPSISRAPAGVVRRKVDAVNPTAPPSSPDNASVVPAVSPVSRGTAAAPVLARKVAASAATDRTVPQGGPPASNGSPATADSRTAGSPQVAGIPTVPAVRPLVSAGSAGAPLVLRRMLAAPPQSSTPLSPVMPPATVQLPREETPARPPQKPDPAPATKVGAHTGSDIDRIAEEVGRRLMRRLEIERERKGIRQWR